MSSVVEAPQAAEGYAMLGNAMQCCAKIRKPGNTLQRWVTARHYAMHAGEVPIMKSNAVTRASTGGTIVDLAAPCCSAALPLLGSESVTTMLPRTACFTPPAAPQQPRRQIE